MSNPTANEVSTRDFMSRKDFKIKILKFPKIRKDFLGRSLTLRLEVNVMARGRCMKCRKEVEIKDGKEVTMKNGMSAMKGVCATCGTKVFRILGKAK